MGPGKALDPDKLFLVSTELVGNGRSSSPSNTPEPFHTPRFPVMTIRDNVEAVHCLLVDELKISHLRALMATRWERSKRFNRQSATLNFVDRVVATSGTAKCYPHGFVRLKGQIAAITTDPVFAGGDYKTRPENGLAPLG